MGMLIAIVILFFWLGHLVYSLLYVETDFSSIFFYLHILIQAFLYTGLFITGHDAMHGSVAKNRKVNDVIGHISTTLFAFLSFRVLAKKHYMHHLYPASEKDPDFSVKSNNFFVWWFSFMRNYTTWWQIILMAITFNILLIWFDEFQVIFFWVLPAVISTFQLFFFGTWLPHRRPLTEEMKPYNARTLRKNHFLAMISCYFFGYHWEHHQSPTTPWWRLYQLKE